jgi:hypothetical protein
MQPIVPQDFYVNKQASVKQGYAIRTAPAATRYLPTLQTTYFSLGIFAILVRLRRFEWQRAELNNTTIVSCHGSSSL